MNGKQISEYKWIYPITGHLVWQQRFIYLNDVRNTYCPNCECRFEFPNGIESIKFGACPDCKTVFFYYPSNGFWYYLPDNFEFDVDICPDCGKEDCPEQPEMANFHYCLNCNIEFCWQLNSIENGLICFKYPYKDGKYIVTKQQMNEKYHKPDPFGVKSDPADAVRKSKIIGALNDWVAEKRSGQPFKRALDIGCGEGFITVDIPADEIVGFDVSDVALSRVPSGTIVVVDDPANIKGKFDCIIVTGTLVREYDFVQILNLIDAHASDFVLTCQTDLTEVHEVNSLKGTQVHVEEFPYREHKQRIRVFSYADVEPVAPTEPLGDDTGLADPDAENVNSGEGGGPDKTFRELIDEEIDMMPDGHNFNRLILGTEQEGQLIGDVVTDNYRGFILEINDGGPEGRYEFYHRPESVDADLTPEIAEEGEKFPDAPETDRVSGLIGESVDSESETGDTKVNF